MMLMRGENRQLSRHFLCPWSFSPMRLDVPPNPLPGFTQAHASKFIVSWPWNFFRQAPWGETCCRGPRLYALLVQYRFHILAFSLVEGFSEKEEPITLKSGPCSYYCASWLSISFSPVSGYILSTFLVLPPHLTRLNQSGVNPKCCAHREQESGQGLRYSAKIGNQRVLYCFV